MSTPVRDPNARPIDGSAVERGVGLGTRELSNMNPKKIALLQHGPGARARPHARLGRRLLPRRPRDRGAAHDRDRDPGARWRDTASCAVARASATPRRPRPRIAVSVDREPVQAAPPVAYRPAGTAHTGNPGRGTVLPLHGPSPDGRRHSSYDVLPLRRSAWWPDPSRRTHRISTAGGRSGSSR
jgi:hypothetical protein